MAGSALTSLEVTRARRYAARVRIAMAVTGGVLLALGPDLGPHPEVAALGFVVIGATGFYELLVPSRRGLAVEEALSPVAAITIIGWRGDTVDVLSVLWLVAAASGVLARGGRAGVVGPVVTIAALFSPLVTQGGMSLESLGFAIGAIALFLAMGRISRETAALLERARYDAAHDALTGLLAPAAFRETVDRLSALATEAQPAALIGIDLDDFGAVNKREGHAAGDRLLVAVSAAMGSTLREEDVLARLGGDEFAAYVVCDDPLPVAERLLDAVASAGAGRNSARAGIARCPHNGTGAEALLPAADVALRLCKRGGSAVAVYDGVSISSDTSEGARAALERLTRGDGLEIAVQPIIDLSTGQPHAFEALARFATRGGQGPSHWFALAEELGLRAELELACLRAACGLIDELPPATRLAVNLSAPLLADERTAEVLRGCDVSRVIVEVTEQSLVRQAEAERTAIDGLRERGARFAVDDVGAGYSGLGQLAALRPTYIKLDRALVRGLDRELSRLALVRALADYARDSGGMLVAEGVETPAELAEVRAAGVPLAQGYLLARPAPPWPTCTAAYRVSDLDEDAAGAPNRIG